MTIIDKKWLSPSGQLKRVGVPQHVRTQFYIEKAVQRHGNTYNYTSFVPGPTTRDLVTIICKKHGTFSQQLNQHLSGSGCEKCYLERIAQTRTKPHNQFVQEAAKVHNNFYTYPEVPQSNCKTKVPIVCPEHGVFKQERRAHLKGSGCPQCQGKFTHIYLFYDTQLGLVKIGVSSNPARRLKDLGVKSIINLVSTPIQNPYKVEQLLHNKYQALKELHPTQISGNTEFFRLPLEEIQELKHYVESL